MRSLMNWVRSNLVTVISIAVVFVSFLVLGWTYSQGAALEAKVAKRSQTLKQIQSYSRKSVPIPGERPDDPVEMITGVTINEVATSQLKELYGRMREEYDQLSNFVLTRNQQGKHVLVEGLFPSPQSPDIPFDARDAYRQDLVEMLLPADPDQPALPRLDAGMPPDQAFIDKELDEVRQNYMAGRRVHGVVQEQDTAELRQEQRERLIELLRERAQQIHLYAVTDIDQLGFPFDVGAWSSSSAGERPTMDQLWEGQLELWFQEDLATAFAKANQVDNPDVDVMTLPIKRLMRVEIIPGYIGLHTFGPLGSSSASSMPYPMPAMGQTGNAEQQQPDNFYVGPSGRSSNAVYDVRQARVTLVADFQQLPVLFEAINDTNFLSVLQCRIQRIDEYEALSQGFVYGLGDAVEVELLIESIWLRAWTEPLMPSIVRQYVGIDPPDEKANARRAIESVPSYYNPYGEGAPPPR